MTQFPWHVGPAELSALRGNGGQPFVDFVSALLRAEASVNGLKIDDVDTNIRVNIADGGVDAEVRAPLGGPLAIDVPSCWQFKATEFSNIGQADLRKEANKPEAIRLIGSGHVYFVCVCDDAPSVKMNELGAALLEIVRIINPNAPQPRLLNCGDLADWADRHPSIVLRFFRQHFGHALAYDRWLHSERADLPKFVELPSRANVMGAIRAHLDVGMPAQAVLAVAGPAGAGLSRMVAEALTPASDRVLFVQDPATAIPTVTSLINQTLASAIVVVDSCPVAIRAELEKLLRAETKRLRVIAIQDPRQEASNAAVKLSKLDETDLQKIIEANFSSIPSRHSRAISLLSDGLPKLAAAMAQTYVRDPSRFLEDAAAWAIENLQCIVPDPQDIQVLRALALFKRVGHAGGIEHQLAIACGLFGLNSRDALRRARRLAVSPSVVLIGPRYLSVRPRMFARALFESAWSEVATDPAKFLDGQTALLTGLLKQAALHAHPSAREAIAKWADSWLRTLTSQSLREASTVKRLMLLVDVSPSRVAPILTDLVLSATDEEALAPGESLDGWPVRHRVYWKLGQLLERRETHPLAEAALFRLARAEARTGGPILSPTAATEVWAHSFRLFLSGTEVPYLERLKVLQAKLDTHGDQFVHLVVAALDSAVEEYASRSEGTPFVAGRVRPQEWVPSTYGEFWDCLDAAITLLGRCLVSPTGGAAAFDVLVKHGRGLMQSGRAKALQSVLSSVSLTEQQRVSVWGFVSDYLTFDTQAAGEENGPPKDYVDSVESWHRTMRRDDLVGRVLEALSHSGCHDQHENTNEWTTNIEHLGAELSSTPTILIPLLSSLVSDDHHPSALIALGRSIGKVDVSASLLESIFASACSAKSPIFLRGYIWGLADQGTTHDRQVAAALDELETNHPELAVDLNAMNGRVGTAGERALRLVRAGRLPAAHFKQVHAIGFQPELLGDVLDAILDKLSEQPEEAAQVALDVLLSLIWDEKQDLPTEARIEAAMWRVLEAGANGAGGKSHCWAKLLRRLADRDLPKALVLAGTAASSGDFHQKDEAAALLSSYARREPELVLDCLGAMLLDLRTSWCLSIGRHGAFINELPIDVVRPWLDDHGSDGAVAIARHITPPVVDDQGNVCIPPITRFILERYEDDDKVFESFCSGSGSNNGRWFSGDIAGIHDKEAARLENLRVHPLRRVREWASKGNDYARRQAQWWRQHEEEFDE